MISDEKSSQVEPPEEPRIKDPLPESNIMNVWKHNVKQEFKRISLLLDEGFTWVAMDTEFPGILYNFMMDNQNQPEMGYLILKMNVDNLKLIQAGISLAKKNGEKPKGVDTW